jgi:hypothetical protein
MKAMEVEGIVSSNSEKKNDKLGGRVTTRLSLASPSGKIFDIEVVNGSPAVKALKFGQAVLVRFTGMGYMMQEFKKVNCRFENAELGAKA